MTAGSQGFAHSDHAEPHKERTRAILRAHPEVREHIGKNAWSFLGILFIVGAQLSIAWLVSSQSWLIVALAAYFIGTTFSHASFVMIHECSHNLLFRWGPANMLAGIFVNIPSTLPSAVSFKRYHLAHHSHQGVYQLDADLPGVWEGRVVGNSWWRKALWLFLFPVLAIFRTLRIKGIYRVDGWVALNFLIVIGMDVAIFMLLGPKALVYLFASFFCAAGLHPYGARWIQRHYLMAGSGEQETFSYYGGANNLAFNVGYHNEHHDFPSIPWNRLPRLKAAAPEFYDPLISHTSWTKLLFRFVFDPRISIFSRMTREDPEAVAQAVSSMEKDSTTAVGSPGKAVSSAT